MSKFEGTCDCCGNKIDVKEGIYDITGNWLCKKCKEEWNDKRMKQRRDFINESQKGNLFITGFLSNEIEE